MLTEITITGTGFGTAMPTVDMAGQSLSVVSFGSTQIVASLPTALQAAGAYHLAVANNSGTTPVSGTFDATIPPLTINGLVNSGGQVIGSNAFGYTVTHLEHRRIPGRLSAHLVQRHPHARS
jgi:hypothetical protein